MKELLWEMHTFLNLRDPQWLCEKNFYPRPLEHGRPSSFLSLTEAQRVTEELPWEMHAFLNLCDSQWLCERNLFPRSIEQELPSYLLSLHRLCGSGTEGHRGAA